MRAIWTGAVTFGLVNIPVRLYAATTDHDIDLHQVHDADGGRIRYERRCEVCRRKIDYEHIDKAYDDGETTVVLTDEDLASLPAERNHEIEVVRFVPSEQIDPLMLERSYYLEPDSKSAKAYVLLRKTLEKTDLTSVVKFALRQKTRLGILRVRGKVLMLQSLLWSDEVREADFPAIPSRVRISEEELEMSAALVERYADDFNPEEFQDDYQVELRRLIDEKLKQGEALDTEATFGAPEESEAGDLVDLMEALKKSLERRGAGTRAGRKAPSHGAKGSAPRRKGA
ncbi:non-homologous end joining protein Ku [Arthrobacter mobilis]|uniref:Non-homologous end joining protein Ku n=1 Tax=Arthrobacter mobilis TaxID=2724944 RepID=A0A7X6HGJ2_9MICC|nr:Ku protein [Arthrobacter mobilis]NKX55814.1 Ku protein [Arthrobacter mobilis]